MKKFIFTSLLSLLCAAGLRAAELGDAAQPLDIKEWVKGGPVDLSTGKGKTIYVVEFWATWCPPCRESIPHLTELQKKFKDQGVVFVGVTDEKSDVVKKFVEKMGDSMDYNVAIDGGKTSEAYMQAFGINGIPHAFVVDKEGKIVWQGHPMDHLEETLQALIDGKYDMAKAKKAGEAQEKLQKYIQLSLQGGDADEIKKLEDELVALDKEVGGIMNGKKFDPADIRARIKFSQLLQKYQQAAMGNGDTNELADLEKQLEATAPKDLDFAKFKAGMQQAIERNKEMGQVKDLFRDYMTAVGENGDAAKAAELAKKVEALELKNPQLLNDIAWTILTDDSIKARDTQLALKLAKRAADVTESKEPGVLDTYARALFDNGQTTEAIAQQKKAIELAEDEDMKGEMQKTLDKYEAKAKEGK